MTRSAITAVLCGAMAGCIGGRVTIPPGPVSTASFHVEPRPMEYRLKAGDRLTMLYMLDLERDISQEYRLEVNGMKVEATAEIIRSELKDGKRSATLESRAGGVTTKEELSSDDKGVYRTSFNGVPTDKPITIVKYPTKAETWTESVKIMGMEMKATTTAKAVAEVKVAAGTYKAIPVEVVAEIAGQKILATTWYADGVGAFVVRAGQVADLLATAEPGDDLRVALVASSDDGLAGLVEGSRLLLDQDDRVALVWHTFLYVLITLARWN
jgi:hypothetical protein